MRRSIAAFTAFLLLATQVQAKESKNKRNALVEMMRTLGMDVMSGDKLDRAIAKAEEHPLGTKENPVRADGPPGQRAYLARLRCPDDSVPQLGMRTNAGPGPFRTIVDVYPLRCGENGPSTNIYMDMYFLHIEDRPPPGFTIQSSSPAIPPNLPADPVKEPII